MTKEQILNDPDLKHRIAELRKMLDDEVKETGGITTVDEHGNEKFHKIVVNK